MTEKIEQLFRQPLDVILKRLNIYQMVALGFVGWLIYDMWSFYKLSVQGEKLGDTALLGFAGIVVGVFVKIVNSIDKES